MRTIGTVLAFCLLIRPAFAQEGAPRPDTPEQAAERVLAAVEAKEEAALEILAERDDPDPWLVADDLLFRGEPAAALAFAGAASRPDTKELPAHVSSRGGAKEERAPRAVLEEAIQAMRGRDPASALAALERAGPERSGVVFVRLFVVRGHALRALRRLHESTAAFDRAAAMAENLGWLRRQADALNEAAVSAYYRSDFAGALARWERRLTLEEKRGDRAGMGATLGNIGNVLGLLGDDARALEYQERALVVFEEVGDLPRAATALRNIGLVQGRLGEHVKAIGYLTRAHDLLVAVEDRYGAARVLGNIGRAHDDLGDLPEALEYLERSVALYEKLEDPAALAGALCNTGIILSKLGDYPRSLALQERYLELQKELGDRPGMAGAYGNLGLLYEDLGDYPKAKENLERALTMMEELGNPAGVAASLGNLGNLHLSLGEYPKALERQERALELRVALENLPGQAISLSEIGRIYDALRDHPKALEYYERCLELSEELEDRAGVAVTLEDIGMVYRTLQDYPKALDYMQRALEAKKELNARSGIATTIGNIALLYSDQDEHRQALEYQQRALRLREELGDRMGLAASLGNLGVTYERMGDFEKALELQERALALARTLDRPIPVIFPLWHLTRTHRARGAPREAVRAAREADEMLRGIAGGLGEEQGAGVRERFTNLYAVGVLAAADLDDPVEVSHFMESGRAGTLLEHLSARDELNSFLLPEDLRAKLQRARAREAVAATHHALAKRKGSRKGEKEARARLDAARERVREVVLEIQREAKAAADVIFPSPDPLSEIQERLEEGEALVLYLLDPEGAVALVVTHETSRVVKLGDPGKIAAAAVALRQAGAGLARGLGLPREPDRAPEQSEAAAAELQKLVVAPLGLGPEVERILVSPHGDLCRVPFVLLAGEREVAYLPSGTTYGVLMADRGKRGTGVVALGDPEYGRNADPRAASVFRRSGALVPLPATRAEAKAVGDVVLLGREATEGRLAKAIAGRPRWRAVHLATHGLIDHERPTLSSLALTPDSESDGFLTCLEVFRMKIPSDLVVLSACETAGGKVYRAEGIVGLTRAFMMAGAPRVICSLWKVDDAATQALMVKFYELWNPKEGEGLPAATALRQAQEFVRGQEKWKHPFYWAAWVLWGLPD